jgi:hypothetical protein
MDQKAQERIAICKDALAWVEAGALIPSTGQYVRPEVWVSDEDFRSGKQLRDINLGKCSVCLRGALFLAKAVRFDNVWATNRFYAEPENRAALLEHFDNKQIELVEVYYEGTIYTSWHREVESWHEPVAEKFHSKYLGRPSERMTIILQNIIDNEGTFCPEKL